MKKNAGIVLAMILYAFLAVGIVFVIYIGGTYPVGADAMSHVYKGNVLYHNISQGNWYPLYDNLWYNGVALLGTTSGVFFGVLSIPSRWK